jgi:hypothetical protein
MLTSSGTVRLNGAVIPRSTSIFTGDVVDTAAESVGSLSRSGSSIVVDPNSSIRYQDDGFALMKGTARVQTSKGMMAHTGPISVVPVSDTALFDVSTDGKTALIASRQGALTLSAGGESFILDPGHTAKVNLDLPQDQQAPKPAATGGEKKKLKAPPAWLIYVIVGGAAAAAVTCAFLCGGGGGAAVSPVAP